MPLYLKDHSYGEYVFDWAWADAYHRNRRPYYPKLVSAIPFTPAGGPRVRFAPGADREKLASELIARGLDVAAETNASSWHILFPDDAHLKLLRQPELLYRQGVQYHWFNRNFEDFDGFLGQFNSRKRKMVRRERREVADQGFVIEQFTGAAISPELWQRFALFYQRTYMKRSGSRGYLTKEFFQTLGENMAEQCLLVTARAGNQPDGQIVAAAFYLFDASTLYGRYWGCLQEYDFLHFELCYYQGIDFAIRHRLDKFDAGAQGEHKIVRGFEPVLTHSLHWIAEPAFAAAIGRFLGEEKAHIAQHMQQAREMLPFRHDQ